MNYLLFICSDGVPTEEKGRAMREHLPAWIEEMDGRRIRQFGQALAPASRAQTVRVRDGETIVSDGPFAESKEFIAGFDVIECRDLDEAIEVAAKHSVSWFHSIEIRPFAESPLGPNGDGGDSALPGRDVAAASSIGASAPGRQRFLLSVCVNGIAESDEEEAAIHRDGMAWADAAAASGHRIYGHALRGPETATTVRVREGETLVSDGPFVETKEFIGGFDIFECVSQQEAVELAARHPIAGYHMVEVRPFAAGE